ncbi:MAG: pseudouridine synthase [Leptolyngbyaceae cyanobacterium SL_7_1]|nr:pseudouridine synthase [Leptolyngbyaceae cyanobacterium SL_7_1]
MPHRYLLFYKPYNVLTQFTHPGETGSPATGAEAIAPARTLKQFIPIANVYPVGRLDQDSEGLLLLTDDGALQHRLSDPKFHHPRTYWVQVERIPSQADLNQLRQGVTIRVNGKDYRTRPIAAQLIPEPTLPPRDPPIRFRKTVPTAWLEITLTEGKNRQVRRMTAAIGFPTLRLVRVAIAHLRLEGLSPGEWRDLTPEERQRLHKNV